MDPVAFLLNPEMSLTAYQPDIHSLSQWDYRFLEGISTRRMKSLLEGERKRLLDDLRLRYYDAVDLYNLSGMMDRFIAGSSQPALTWEAGMIYAALDYSHAQFTLPSSPNALGQQRSTLFLDYLRQRAQDNLRANAYQLMEALAIASRLPDQWFPEEILVKRIQQKIRSIPIYHKPEVELSLAIPAGGLLWMGEATRQALEQALPQLQSGQPVIFRLVRSLKNLAENRQVIVYAWQELPMERGQQAPHYRIDIHEPACILHEHYLLVNSGAQPPAIQEVCPPGSSLPVLGLLLDQYIPQDVPAELIPPLLHNIFIRQFNRLLHRFALSRE